MLKLSRWMVLGLAILGAVHLAVLSARESRGKRKEAVPYTPALAEMAAESYGARAIEPRVSGGFRYAPYRVGQRLAISRQSKGWRQLLREGEEDSPEALGAAAIAHLIGGDPEKAMALLQKALAQSKRDPRLLSDLAAAYLVRGEKAGTPYDFVQALAAADRALGIALSLEEAQYNKAFALTLLGLTPAAEKAWRAYRDLDLDSEWNQEADCHLQSLARPREADLWTTDRGRLDAAALAGRTEEVRWIVQTYRQPARLYVEDELLGQWAESQADRPLILARAVAEALGMRMLREEVAAAEEAVREGGARLSALVRGHGLYARARKLHEQQKYPEAEPLFRQAAQALREGRSPFSAWPELYLAIITHHHADQPRAIRQLEDLRGRFAALDYAPLLGTIDWMIGQARGVQGPIASALPASESALRQFQRAGEIENQAAMDSTLARIYTELGELQRAWPHHQAALQVLPRLYKPRRIQNILAVAIQSLRKTGDLAPAVYFQEMLVEEAHRAGNPVGITVALKNQAALFHELGRQAEAIASLDQARGIAGRIEDPVFRQSVDLEIVIAGVRVLRDQRPEAALPALNQALAMSLQNGNRHFLIQILQERAATWLTLGQESEAEADLEAGLAELERQRRTLEDDKLRVFFADQGRALLEERIELQRRREESAEATLDTAERLRARALLDTLSSADPAVWPEPLPAREIAAALPAGVAIVEYLWVRDNLQGWVITHRGVETVDLGAGRENIEGLIDRFLLTLKAPDSNRLYRRLLSPLKRHLAGVSTLIFIPDGKLCRIPFAALQDDRGRFLVENFRLATAPSASVYLALAKRYQERSTTTPDSILLVGEPEFDRGLFPTLPSLDASAREIETLGRLYDRSLVLTGEAATAERFLKALPGEDVLHFAGHTVTPPGAEAPSLLLTRSAMTGSSGLLAPEAIRSSRPLRTRLAVLAGCRTAEGRLSRNEGTLGLARSFLIAGVPAVIASLWDVDDEPSSRLVLRFHELLRSGADPMAALRQAQLELLSDNDHSLASPHGWAAFQLVGGSR